MLSDKSSFYHSTGISLFSLAVRFDLSANLALTGCLNEVSSFLFPIPHSVYLPTSWKKTRMILCFNQVMQRCVKKIMLRALILVKWWTNMHNQICVVHGVKTTKRIRAFVIKKIFVIVRR